MVYCIGFVKRWNFFWKMFGTSSDYMCKNTSIKSLVSANINGRTVIAPATHNLYILALSTISLNFTMMMISRIFFFLHCQIQLMTFKEFKEFSLIILMLKFDAWHWFLSNFGEVFSNLPLTIQLPLIFFSISPSLLLIYSRKWIHWARGTPDVICPFSVVFGSLIIKACNHSVIGWPRVSWANSLTEYARKKNTYNLWAHKQFNSN